MPVLWSPDMKDQHQASTQEDLEKRLRFLDEYKRIGDKTSEIDIGDVERDGEEAEAEDKSPSSQFFLTK